MVDLIYDAVAQPALWANVIDRVVEMTGAENGVITRLDVIKGTGSGTLPSEINYDSINDYASHFYKINPLVIVNDLQSYANSWRPNIILDEDIIARDKFEHSEYYNDYLRKHSAEWVMIIRLRLSGSEVASLNLARQFKRGRFEGADVDMAKTLQGHLVRANALCERFATLQTVNSGLSAALDQSAEAMLLLDGDGRILHQNASAERLLAENRALKVSGGCLTASDPVAAGQFTSLIGRASSPDREMRRGASISLRQPNSADLLTVSASPLSLEAASDLAKGSAILVSLKTGTGGQDSRDDALTARYGLTGAERRLVSALRDGLSLREASARHAISYNTARAQISNIFAKTGTRRQIDLVRLMTTG